MQNDTDKKRLAIFDFDGTISRGDTLLPFLWHITNPLLFLYKMIISSPWLLGYAAGFISNHQAKNRLLIHFLGGRSLRDIQELSRSFVNNKLPSLIRSKAIEAVRQHQQNKDTCILISASPNIYLDLWGRENSFDYIITTRIAKNESIYIGGIDGKNCYGEEKVNRLKEVIGDLRNYYIISYGDSQGDEDLFDISDEVNFKPFRN